jgi:divalent metal cation (Fe/Co/Zn/Cd) transporter
MLRGSSKGRLLVQIAFVLLTLAGVVALLAATALLTSESPAQRWWALGILGVLAVTLIVFRTRRRRNRQSLDEALRSRRR